MKTYYESELKELQGKRYTDVKELEKAEAEVNKEVAKKQELASVRKAEADKVSKTIVNLVEVKKEAKQKKLEAYKKYLQVSSEQDKKVEEAEKEQYNALNEFCKKYPEGFHETIKVGDTETRFNYSTTVEDNLPSAFDIFNWLFR